MAEKNELLEDVKKQSSNDNTEKTPSNESTNKLLKDIRDILLSYSGEPKKPPVPYSVNKKINQKEVIDFTKKLGHSVKYIRFECTQDVIVKIWTDSNEIELPWVFGADKIYTLTEFVQKISFEVEAGATLKLFATSIPPASSGTSAAATYSTPGGIGGAL